MNSLRLLAGCAPLLLGTCIGVDIPEAPDLSEAVAAFRQPTADIDAATLAAAEARIAELIEITQELGILELVQPLLEELQEELSGEGDGNVPNIEARGGSKRGVVRLRHTCPGWQGVAAPDPNVTGQVDLTSTIRGGRLQSVVWGPASACRYLVPLADRTIQVGLDADVNMDLDGLLGIAEALEGRMLTFTFGGTAFLGERFADLRFSFRIRLDRSFEVAVVNENEDVFVVLFDTDESLIGIRANNGTFECDFEQDTCTGPEGSFSW